MQTSSTNSKNDTSRIFFPRPESIPAPPKPFRRSDKLPVALKPLVQSSPDIDYFENRPMTGPELFKLYERFGDRVFFYSGGTLSVALFNWDDVRQVLSASNADFIKGPFESVIGAGVGWGLLTQEGQSHKSTRHKFNSGFHSSAMDYLEPQICQTFDKNLATFTSETGFEALPALRRLTHEITLRGILGVHELEESKEFEEHLYWLAHFMTHGSFATNSVSQMDVETFIRARSRFLSYADRVTQLIVDGGQIAEPTFGKVLGKEHSGPIVRGQGTHAQVAQFLSAGTETTASLLSSMLFLHTQTPSDWSALKSAAEADESSELDARLDEALRLFPPASISTRVPTREVELSGVTLPAGIQVFVSPYVTQRMEVYFDRPKEYDWARWMTQERDQRRGYFPFGFGPRMCIGYSAARHTAKSVLRLFTSSAYPGKFQAMPDYLEQYIVLGPSRAEKLYFSKV